MAPPRTTPRPPSRRRRPRRATSKTSSRIGSRRRTRPRRSSARRRSARPRRARTPSPRSAKRRRRRRKRRTRARRSASMLVLLIPLRGPRLVRALPPPRLAHSPTASGGRIVEKKPSQSRCRQRVGWRLTPSRWMSGVSARSSCYVAVVIRARSRLSGEHKEETPDLPRSPTDSLGSSTSLTSRRPCRPARRTHTLAASSFA
mmetsp:Transcript_24904/g.98900  ORF Transcript_24904/g.98900 Transcript_24904/m.98900 type:complete len:202 (+) Transcript_24904:105-710(+)